MPKGTLSPMLTHADRNAIRLTYLSDPACTIKTLAEHYQVPLYKVSDCLKGPQYDAFKADFHKAIAGLAKDKLATLSEQAVELWGKAMAPASAKGDHRPMKDLLVANRIIDQGTQQPHVTVLIGLSLGDASLGPMPVTVQQMNPLKIDSPKESQSIGSESQVPIDGQLLSGT